MPARIIRAIGLAALVLASAARADDAALRFGTEAVNAPLEYKDTDGVIKGMEIDLVEALCARMKRSCVWVNMAFDSLIPALQARKIEAAIAQISITAERRKVILFSDPLTNIPARLVARKGSGISDDPATLKGKVIGVQSGTTHERYLNERLKDIAVARIYPTQEEAYLDLEGDRIDATLGDQSLSWDWIQKEGKPDFEFAGKILVDPEIFGEGTGIALRQDEGALKQALDQAIAAILADGTFDRITGKYFPFSLRPQ